MQHTSQILKKQTSTICIHNPSPLTFHPPHPQPRAASAYPTARRHRRGPAQRGAAGGAVPAPPRGAAAEGGAGSECIGDALFLAGRTHCCVCVLFLKGTRRFRVGIKCNQQEIAKKWGGAVPFFDDSITHLILHVQSMVHLEGHGALTKFPASANDSLTFPCSVGETCNAECASFCVCVRLGLWIRAQHGAFSFPFNSS